MPKYYRSAIKLLCSTFSSLFIDAVINANLRILMHQHALGNVFVSIYNLRSKVYHKQCSGPRTQKYA